MREAGSVDAPPASAQPPFSETTMPSKYNEAEAAIAFWDRVDRSGGNDACWPWRGALRGGRASKMSSQYGVTRWLGRRRTAHRLAFELTNGPITSDVFVCHACDNPPCCNPRHLWAGDAAANMKDRDAKGRGVRVSGDAHFSRARPGLVARGERHGRSKIDEASVLLILESSFRGESCAVLATRHGLSYRGVRDIVTRKTWKHVTLSPLTKERS